MLNTGRWILRRDNRYPLSLYYLRSTHLSRISPSISYAGLPSTTGIIPVSSSIVSYSTVPLRSWLPTSSDFSQYSFASLLPSITTTGTILSRRWMTASPKKKARRLALQNGTLTPEQLLTINTKKHKHHPVKQFQKFSVALIGRPNVGKSSLFNRLAHKRLAIVNAIPGTTRDWKEAEGQLGEMSFIIMDTGGLEDQNTDKFSIEQKMLQHTEQAIKLADVVLFIIDARQGVTHDDERFARWIKQRRPQGHIHLIANKTEGWVGTAHGDEQWEQIVKDCYRLGFGEPVPISAEHGEGLLGVYQTLEPYGLIDTTIKNDTIDEPSIPQEIFTSETPTVNESEDTSSSSLPETRGRQRRRRSVSRVDRPVMESESEHTLLPIASPTSSVPIMSESPTDNSLPDDPQSAKKVQTRLKRMETPIQLAIVGRPNVGKSTLVNQLLGEQRVLSGPTPGLTRDAVKVELMEPITERKIQLVDTAGMRRWGTWDLSTPLEGLAVGLAKKALAMSNVVALVIDGSGGHSLGLTNDPITFSSSTLSIRPPSTVSPNTTLSSKPSTKVSHRPPPEDTGKAFGMTVQDLAIAHQIMDEGRGLVLILNKMDACPNPQGFEEVVRQQMERTPHGKGVEIITLSALRGLGMEQLLPAVLRVYDRWNRRIATARLNIWLQLVSRHHPPPTVRRVIGMKGTGANREYNSVPVAIRLKYITQITSRPPTFNLFVNRPDVPEYYTRYIVNSLREEFDLKGIPIRFNVRSSINPYTKAGRMQLKRNTVAIGSDTTVTKKMNSSTKINSLIQNNNSTAPSPSKYRSNNIQEREEEEIIEKKVPLSQEIQRRMRSLMGSGGTLKPFSRKDKRIVKEMKLTPKRKSKLYAE